MLMTSKTVMRMQESDEKTLCVWVWINLYRTHIILKASIMPTGRCLSVFFRNLTLIYFRARSNPTTIEGDQPRPSLPYIMRHLAVAACIVYTSCCCSGIQTGLLRWKSKKLKEEILMFCHVHIFFFLNRTSLICRFHLMPGRESGRPF